MIFLREICLFILLIPHSMLFLGVDGFRMMNYPRISSTSLQSRFHLFDHTASRITTLKAMTGDQNSGQGVNPTGETRFRPSNYENMRIFDDILCSLVNAAATDQPDKALSVVSSRIGWLYSTNLPE
jgi:hypothetical protein